MCYLRWTRQCVLSEVDTLLCAITVDETLCEVER